MKKCPKCGTVLDDSKKKCYMCGSDLHNNSVTNFGDAFDAQIGATVTKSQDNVFSNVSNITASVNDVVSAANNNDNSKGLKNANATFTQKSSTADFFKKEMNGLNSLQQYDEKSTIEKMFSNKSSLDKTKTIDAKDAMNKNSNSGFSQNPMGNNMPQFSSGMNNGFSNNQMMPQQAKPVKQQPVKPSKKATKQQPNINWGNDLRNSGNKNFFGNNGPKKSSSGISFSFIFNTVCFILFLIGFGFIYFKYIRNDETGDVSFGGLHFVVDDSFVLKSDDDNSKYYTYGNNCSVRINYGSSGGENYVDEYFNKVKATYEGQEGYTTRTDKIKINGNVWTEMSIIELKKTGESETSYSTYVRYRYSSIVHKGSFYDIIFSNTDDNPECAAKYDALINSMSFD